MELIPIIYHGKKYPFGIKSEIEEIAGHLDKETINPKNKYSLHTDKEKFLHLYLAFYPLYFA